MIEILATGALSTVQDPGRTAYRRFGVGTAGAMDRLALVIGNALVDKEFEVEDQFFVDAGIEKGFMTLIDADKQQELVAMLTQRYGLKKRAGGGSAANSMYALSQFGGRVFFSCKVANDETGHFYVKELGSQNISTNLSS